MSRVRQSGNPMKKAIISVIGYDRPGIIAIITKILFKQGCNIENVHQTILQSQFAGTFIASFPASLSVDVLDQRLSREMAPHGFEAHVIEFDRRDAVFDDTGSESFVITTKGPDRKGLVAGITAVIADHGANVTNLQAVFKGGDDPSDNIMIYEVDIPIHTRLETFYKDLRVRAEALDLKISIQHRNIFEAINRI